MHSWLRKLVGIRSDNADREAISRADADRWAGDEVGQILAWPSDLERA